MYGHLRALYPGSLNPPQNAVKEIIEGTQNKRRKKRSPKRAEGGAREPKVDRAVLHILTVLRVPPAPAKSLSLFFFFFFHIPSRLSSSFCTKLNGNEKNSIFFSSILFTVRLNTYPVETMISSSIYEKKHYYIC